MRQWPSLILRFPPGVTGETTDLVVAGFDPDAVAAIEERTDTEWIVSFRDPDARDRALLAIRREWDAQGVRAVAADISDEDWARRSQASLGAVCVGRFVVLPPWMTETDPLPADGIRLVIEPSMGFGSGHHATTRLCLTALQSLPVAGTRVLDIGTGSGILAIAASLLGAADVLGVDNDPDALESARADAAMNGIATGLTFAELDFRAASLAQADIVLANLTGSMLAANVDAILRCVAPGGRLILSGITAAEADAVLTAWAPATHVLWRGDELDWVGLLVETKPPVYNSPIA